MQAGLQLKNTLYSKDAAIKTQYQQRWLSFTEDVRTHVKQKVIIIVDIYIVLVKIIFHLKKSAEM